MLNKHRKIKNNIAFKLRNSIYEDIGKEVSAEICYKLHKKIKGERYINIPYEFHIGSIQSMSMLVNLYVEKERV